MDRGNGLENVAGRRHIIRRPRLTRLLDETSARIIVLVAAAGYGKTTLAHEWLSEPGRRSGWYRGSAASADVAALAVGIAEAAATIVPKAGRHMRERLRATDEPEQEVRPLTELLAEDLAGWPEDAWLVLDDYHFASESPAAEEFVELLSALAPVQMLITSRRRPRWVSARRILYGELLEVGADLLAMSDEEAAQVLSSRGEDLPALVARARGWPAVIGLAALTEEQALPKDDLPAALYDYFAEELYQTAEPAVRWGLCQLAVTPSITLELAQLLFGTEAGALILEHAVRLGVLAPNPNGTFELHPLLRAFLEAKLREHGRDAVAGVVATIGRFLLEREQWDDVFSLVQRFSAADLLVTLVEEAAQSMLRDGRLVTLSRWLKYAEDERLSSPVFDLAEAEIARRQGLYERAEALALAAGRRLGPRSPLASRAYYVAGQAAHLTDGREHIALSHFSEARALASNESDVHEALWGQFISTVDAEDERSAKILEEFAQLSSTETDDILRIANARLMFAMRLGTLQDVIDSSRPLMHVLAKASDPMIRSSFLNSFWHVLVVGGEYGDALDVARLQLLDAAQYRLTFVLPHAHIICAMGHLGLRQFGHAASRLDQAEQAASQLKDVHLAMSARAVRARLCLAQGAHRDAVAVTEPGWDRISTRGMYGEYLACRALALACAGECEASLETAATAQRATQAIEVRGFVPWVRAVVAVAQGSADANHCVRLAFEALDVTGNVDALVSAYRAHPELLPELANEPAYRQRLHRIVGKARDEHLGERAGLATRRHGEQVAKHGLTRREAEVHRLLALGLSNKEIAHSLYISEATVKVHVKHVFDKLGVRSRTEAAIRGFVEEMV